MCLVKVNGKKEILVMKNLCQKYREKFFRKIWPHSTFWKRKRTLRDFGYKNIDELVDALDNTKTDEELDELFDKITNKLAVLKTLINTVSDIAEKKRIDNVIKGIEFVLDYVAYYSDASDIVNQILLLLTLAIQKGAD